MSAAEDCELLLVPTPRASRQDNHSRAERAAKRRRIEAPIPNHPVPNRRTIQDLPLEILLLIFQWVRPGDMLSLIRTSTQFRRTLLERRFAASVWEFSLKHNVEEPKLPPRPSFLSPLKYAELAFGRHCFKCGRGAPDADMVLWEFRARYCKRCKSVRIVPNNRDRSTSEQRHFQSLMDVCPTRYERVHVRNNAPLATVPVVHKRDIERLKRKLSRAPDEAACKNIMERTKKEKDKMLKVSRSMCHWDQVWRRKRWVEDEGAKERRRKKIVGHLENLGYAPDILLLGPKEKKLAELEVVNTTEILTDEAWKQISPQVVDFMNERKALRLDWEHVQQMRGRLAILDKALMAALDQVDDRELIPHTVDLVNYRKIRAIIEWPADKVVRVKTFDKMLPGLIGQWQREAGDKMAAHLSKSDGSERSGSINPLELAKTIFKCSCGLIRMWPGAASHAHNKSSMANDCSGPNRHSKNFDGTLKPVPLAPFKVAVRARYPLRQPWSPSCFQVCDERVRTATCTEMDRLDARFSCNLCHVPGKLKHLMPWRNAIWHCMRDHVNSAPSDLKWQEASAAETAAAKNVENERVARTEKEIGNILSWYCRHCYKGRAGRTRFTKDDALEHVRKHHSTPNAGDDDVAPDPDRSPLAVQSVYLISNRRHHGVKSNVWEMLDTQRGCFFRFGDSQRGA
ncbi:hypothetical protein B0H21DRAFT_763916 [Amylocystis lapponica]|nr:hypothetical protein B0H21DRAFT_763916 [Amylocystis lapponica]